MITWKKDNKKQHGLVEGGVDRRSVSILKWSHCVTLGKSSAPCEEYVNSISFLCEHLLCATALGEKDDWHGDQNVNLLFPSSFDIESRKSGCKSLANKHA